ncbi:hypothetical protein P8C59_008916 [Phyllachora maydis]|uniref:HBS1-like protein n=1 Tax=Phyllachora maydis TaxID=1825666 RepID=A0AAD9MJ30_9PEZI|nr:hypothetical protein P8C59_008916 [Phyllachora maydis]
MSRHQAVRNLDLEEVLDESYGYEDEDHDMSAEDRTLLAEGTIQVKSALGVAVSKVTTAQIEEALWHYYFDVDKSVAYLVSKFIAPAPKATKPPQKANDACDLPAFCQPVKSEPRQSFAHFFQDMPWGGGPANPPKTSKLAQIAAERKRKLEEKKAQEEAEPRRNVLAEKPRDTNSDFMSSSWSSRLEAEAGKTTTDSAAKKKPLSTDAISDNVKALKLAESPVPKSKNWDVLSEFENSQRKKSASFVVVGHVDAGKMAVNKLDTVGWSMERFNEIKDQITGFLTAKTMGFQNKNIVFVPVSGLHGDNLVRKPSSLAASWYTGSTLVEELEKSEPSARALAKPLRMTISEVFRTTQSAVSISGRIDSGSLQMGDALLVQPSGEKAYVKSLQVDEQPADWAVAGQNLVIHLSNIDVIYVRVGDIVCDVKQPIDCRHTFTLKALAFEFLMPMQVDVHRGRLHSAGRIDDILAQLDKATGAVTKKKPRVVKPGNTVRLIIKLISKVPLEAGQRVILRSGGQTVAAGLLE